jgi:hypothetical protein
VDGGRRGALLGAGCPELLVSSERPSGAERDDRYRRGGVRRSGALVDAKVPGRVARERPKWGPRVATSAARRDETTARRSLFQASAARASSLRTAVSATRVRLAVSVTRGGLEHLRGSALGFRNVTDYIARSLLDAGGFRPPTPSIRMSPFLRTARQVVGDLEARRTDRITITLLLLGTWRQRSLTSLPLVSRIRLQRTAQRITTLGYRFEVAAPEIERAHLRSARHL